MFKILLAAVTICGVLYANDKEIDQEKRTNQQVQQKKQEVQKFVMAALDINKIRGKIQQDLQVEYKKRKEQPSKERLKKANQVFMKKAQIAIQKQGLNVKQYNHYMELLKKDKNFKEHVQKISRELNRE